MTYTRAPVVLRALEEAPNYERAQTLLLTLYDARVSPETAGATHENAQNGVAGGSNSVYRSRWRRPARRRLGVRAAVSATNCSAARRTSITPPDFHGNPAYDGRFTFVRIKYRGFANASAPRGQDGRTTIRAPSGTS